MFLVRPAVRGADRLEILVEPEVADSITGAASRNDPTAGRDNQNPSPHFRHCSLLFDGWEPP